MTEALGAASNDNDALWMALVCFERGRSHIVVAGILPASVRGACGWIAALASDEDLLEAKVERAFELLGLRLLEIGQSHVVDGIDEVEAVDEHLAENVRDWEPGKVFCWGTLDGYRGDGKA